MDKSQIRVSPHGYINLGRQGENAVTEIVFPQPAELMEEHWILNHRRASDREAYPVALEKRDDCLVWSVNSGDTAVAGSGSAELVCTNDSGQVLKSRIYRTNVIKSLDVGEEVPDVVRPWYLDIMASIDEVKDTIGNPDDLTTEAKGTLVDAINEAAQMGGSGESGGYYTPKVTQTDENTMTVEFAPSAEGMPAVEAVTVALPAGEDGYTPVKGTDYYTEEDKEEMVSAVLAALPTYDGEYAYPALQVRANDVDVDTVNYNGQGVEQIIVKE